jgi:NAD(P)-dependent dehydrogenase (short-subunit alcohol dehydrogenase family)
MGELTGQIAVVTGGGTGVGRGIAQQLGAAGAHVIVAGRREQHLNDTVALLEAAGGSAGAIVTDVTDAAQVEALMARTVADRGKIDLLVNNAGRFASIAPVWEADPQNWWRDITVNLFGTFLCCRAAIPRMMERRSGKIVNLGGGGSLAGFAYGSAYGTSKAALIRFSESLHLEVRDYGINVYAISPGLVRTEMTQFQVDSPEGQRWLPHITRRFDERSDVPPALAGRLCVFLASKAGDRLGGRFLQATEDYGHVAEHVDEVMERDLYTLRRNTLTT